MTVFDDSAFLKRTLRSGFRENVDQVGKETDCPLKMILFERIIHL